MKYEIDKSKYKVLEDGSMIYRIKALKNFFTTSGDHVKIGQYGGYIASENNLSQNGSCWVFGDAIVKDNARVQDKACIYDNALIANNSIVKDETIMRSHSKVLDFANVCGRSILIDYAVVKDNAVISGVMLACKALVSDSAFICGKGLIRGKVKDTAQIDAHAIEIDVNGTVAGNALIKGNCIIKGKVLDNATINGNRVLIDLESVVKNYAQIYGNVDVCSSLIIDFAKIESPDCSVTNSVICGSSGIVGGNYSIKDSYIGGVATVGKDLYLEHTIYTSEYVFIDNARIKAATDIKLIPAITPANLTNGKIEQLFVSYKTKSSYFTTQFFNFCKGDHLTFSSNTLEGFYKELKISKDDMEETWEQLFVQGLVSQTTPNINPSQCLKALDMSISEQGFLCEAYNKNNLIIIKTIVLSILYWLKDFVCKNNFTINSALKLAPEEFQDFINDIFNSYTINFIKNKYELIDCKNVLFVSEAMIKEALAPQNKRFAPNVYFEIISRGQAIKIPMPKEWSKK